MSIQRFGAAAVALLLMLALVATAPADAAPPDGVGSPEVLVSGLAGAQGGTVGPGGDLFVAEGALGRITRVDPDTGATSTYAEGLPTAILPIGGVVDVAFIGSQAYALVSLVDLADGFPDNGIYRLDGPSSWTLVADIGQWSRENPPPTDFFLDAGVQYAIETYRGHFVVTDGHHNRVLEVELDGTITEIAVFGNIVPTGIEVQGDTIELAVAGAVPHLPEDGRVLSFGPDGSDVTEVAVGARLPVDVERGRGQTRFVVGQGFHAGGPDGSPAEPDTGELYRVNDDGSLTTLVDGINLPTSMEIIGNAAYVITLTGDIVRIDGIAGPPFG